MFDPYRIRVPLADAIELMIGVLSTGSERILLASSVDQWGYVGPGDCFSLQDGFPSPEVLSDFVDCTGAVGVLFGSRATRSVFDPEETDTALYRHLLRVTEAAGATLVDHLLVKDDLARFMRYPDGLLSDLG